MESMERHFLAAHQDELLETPLSSLLSWSAVQRMGIESCPLCSSCGPEDSPELVDHVLRHAYEFALRALPWPQPIVHNLNVPPGSFNPPEDMEHARGLEQWIDEAAHESAGTPELTLCDYDRADHSAQVLTSASEYSDYFATYSYFDDMSEDKSSRPQGVQSVASIHSTVSHASAVPSPPAFALLPLNSAARDAVERNKNRNLWFPVDGDMCLRIDFSTPEKQIWTLGSVDTDIYLPGVPPFKGPAGSSCHHASFQVVEDTGAALLCDHSDNGTVELLPCPPGVTVDFLTNDTSPKSVLVARGINSRIAFGKNQWYQFEIRWQSDGLYRFPKTGPYTLGPIASRSKRQVRFLRLFLKHYSFLSLMMCPNFF